MVLKRIIKLEQGTVNDDDQFLMDGALQFDFHSDAPAKKAAN